MSEFYRETSSLENKAELWFTENHTPNVRFSIRVDTHLISKKSPFQQIDIFTTPEFGKILVLDGYLMLTEKDEFIYHEMVTHVPMAVNPDIKNVLVIGGGDGGTVKQLVKYDTIEKITLVEIDKLVVDLCREYIPAVASELSDKRVSLKFEDGLKFVRQTTEKFDLIIVDSTDPFGPGEGLFTKEFYGNCCKALSDNGIFVNQHESVFYSEYANAMKKAHSKIKEFFPYSLCYQSHIPTYPSGHWLFGFASKVFDPRRDLQFGKWENLNIKTKYYNTTLHLGAFALPQYVRDTLR
ncbi:MAG: polyamine aminopropyltransferase [Oscillospiraceae bacterium]|jgi:spermidine synthase|nr:polyamine aminopropyltransferase [Oscillospiraceae bacterium]